MKQRQADRFEFEDADDGAESLALYAWAGIAALSALAACVTLLVPVSDTSFAVVEAPAPVKTQQIATASETDVLREPEPDIVVPKQSPLDVAIIRESSQDDIDDAKVNELLEKYREKTETPDPVLTAAVSGEVEDEPALEELRATQPFPGENSIGATIGLSQSVPALAQRYAALQRRAPDLFQAIAPLVEVVEDDGALEARLVAGPFSAQEELSEFCRALRLRITIDCVAGDYSGEPLSR